MQMTLSWPSLTHWHMHMVPSREWKTPRSVCSIAYWPAIGNLDGTCFWYFGWYDAEMAADVRLPASWIARQLWIMVVVPNRCSQAPGADPTNWLCASGNPSPAWHPNGTLYAAVRAADRSDLWLATTLSAEGGKG